MQQVLLNDLRAVTKRKTLVLIKYSVNLCTEWPGIDYETRCCKRNRKFYSEKKQTKTQHRPGIDLDSKPAKVELGGALTTELSRPMLVCNKIFLHATSSS